MTHNEFVYNIIAGTNYNDADDIALRHALSCAMREQCLDDYLRRGMGQQCRPLGGPGRRRSPGSGRTHHRRLAVGAHSRISNLSHFGCHRAKEVGP